MSTEKRKRREKRLGEQIIVYVLQENLRGRLATVKRTASTFRVSQAAAKKALNSLVWHEVASRVEARQGQGPTGYSMNGILRDGIKSAEIDPGVFRTFLSCGHVIDDKKPIKQYRCVACVEKLAQQAQKEWLALNQNKQRTPPKQGESTETTNESITKEIT